MEHTHHKEYIGTPFSINVESVENTPGTWNSSKVSIYNNDKLIGEYLRNYNSYAALTFCPFEQNGEWYALYSAHYTATRVMKLHNDRIEDWCGEEPASNGFCPVEIYVPRYKTVIHDELEIYYTDTEFSDISEFEKQVYDGIVQNTQSTNFGFLCGSVWGDDSCWKIRFIDLSQISVKILSITDKFGYWQMPQTLTLRQCVDMSNWDPTHNWLSLIRSEYINLNTNEHC